jgi:trimeric autotransporter adhesin
MSIKNSRGVETALLAVCCITLSAQQYSISTIAGGVPPSTPSSAGNASISPVQVATDSNGNVFFSSNNAVFEVDSAGLLTQIAGNSKVGASGDGGSALDAQFNRAGGIAIDKDGNVFIADSGNRRVRRVSAGGIISTVAGTGVAGYSGDGGPATGARLLFPTDVAVDGSGNFYIADDFRVRLVSAAGVISTIAGNGSTGYSGDGGPAVNAQLNANALALDNAGNLYVADTANYRVRKISPEGTITTVAGNGTFGFSGDGGPAINAQLWNPTGVAAAANGNIYIADSNNNRVRMVSTNGTITTVAGASYGFSGDGGPAINAGLFQPSSVAVSQSGDLYIVDSDNFRIRQVSTSSVITTIAGNGFANYSGDGGPASNAQLNNPNGVAIDQAGNLYIADTENSRIRKIDTHSVITTVAGNGISGYSGDHGPAINAQLSAPNGVALDLAGNLYIADTGNSVIRKVTPAGVITTIAGIQGAGGFTGDGGPAIAAQLAEPQGVAADSAGNVYIADSGNNRIRKVSLSGVITTIAGSSGAFLGDGNPAISAALNYPWSVAVDAAGDVFIADLYNQRIRKVSPSGIITTIAGNGNSRMDSGDCGPATSASIGEPTGVAVDAPGNVFFASNFVIRKVSPSGIITTIAGNNAISLTDGYVGDGGPALSAGLAAVGLTIEAAGNIYIADGANDAIRLLTQTSGAREVDICHPRSRR